MIGNVLKMFVSVVACMLFFLSAFSSAVNVAYNERPASVGKGTNDGKLCGYVCASDGITPLENAPVTVDDVDCVWLTDENGYYEIDDCYEIFFGVEHLDVYAYPPSNLSEIYLPYLKVAYLNAEEINWVNFTLNDYRASDAPKNFQIIGPVFCRADKEYEYTFSADDPENDQIYFRVNWGDGNHTWYLADSEGKITVSKTWSGGNSYTIWGCPVDKYICYGESDTLEVRVPKSKIINPFERFLDNHPNMFPILRYLLEL